MGEIGPAAVETPEGGLYDRRRVPASVALERESHGPSVLVVATAAEAPEGDLHDLCRTPPVRGLAAAETPEGGLHGLCRAPAAAALESD